MFKFFLIFFIPYICFSLDDKTEKKSSYFYPKLYENLWPDFCLEHLKQFPDECSEQHENKNGNFYLDYIKRGSSEAYIDKEIISRLSNFLTYIPTNSTSCDFIFCKKCNSPIIRGAFFKYEDDNEEESVVCFKCKCLKYWYDDEDDFDDYEETEYFIDENWKYCYNKSIPHSYFNIHSKQFIHFLEHHLKYLQENKKCTCYWPYRSKIACEISDKIYDKIYLLLKESSLKDLNEQINNSTTFPYLKNRTSNGILCGLFIHAFFYIQYREILLFIAKWMNSNQINNKEVIEALDSIYSLIDSIQPNFLKLYSKCLTKHPHPKIYYERGMILFHQNKIFDSLEDIKKMIDWAEKHHREDLLNSDLYLQEGKTYVELGLYDKAVEELSKAIKIDPDNKEAYFERALAYFELGNFDLSLSDYLTSGIKPKPISEESDMFLFSLSLTKGIIKGGVQGFFEFIPSLLSSIHGLGHGLWAFSNDPINVSVEFAKSAQACISFINTHTLKENFKKLVPEIRELIEKWKDFDQRKRGEMIGHIIGKYGVDIFATVGIAKGIKAYRNLKRANSLMTLEALSLSKANKALIEAEALRKKALRQQMLKFIKSGDLNILWDKQGKHIIGHKNYLKDNRSIFMNKNPKKLIKKYAGKGIRDNNISPGKPGYKEIVNFKEFIGYDLNPITGEKTATTWRYCQMLCFKFLIHP